MSLIWFCWFYTITEIFSSIKLSYFVEIIQSQPQRFITSFIRIKMINVPLDLNHTSNTVRTGFLFQLRITQPGPHIPITLVLP